MLRTPETLCGAAAPGLPYYHVPQSSAIRWSNHLVKDNFYGTNRSWGLPTSKVFPFTGPEHVCKDLQTLLAHQAGSKMLLLILLYADAVTRFLCQCHESWLSVLKYLCLAWSAKSLYWAILEQQERLAWRHNITLIFVNWCFPELAYLKIHQLLCSFFPLMVLFP